MISSLLIKYSKSQLFSSKILKRYKLNNKHKALTNKFEKKFLIYHKELGKTFQGYISGRRALQIIPTKERKKDRINLSTLIKIEQYYACSRQALVNRLIYLGIISDSNRDILCNEVIKSARLHGYPETLYLPGNDEQIWGTYGSKAKQLFDEEKISEGHFASLMQDIGIDIFEIIDNNEN
jgi:Zn-dependent peptidase ImmA (M78 family)